MLSERKVRPGKKSISSTLKKIAGRRCFAVYQSDRGPKIGISETQNGPKYSKASSDKAAATAAVDN